MFARQISGGIAIDEDGTQDSISRSGKKSLCFPSLFHKRKH